MACRPKKHLAFINVLFTNYFQLLTWKTMTFSRSMVLCRPFEVELLATYGQLWASITHFHVRAFICWSKVGQNCLPLARQPGTPNLVGCSRSAGIWAMRKATNECLMSEKLSLRFKAMESQEFLSTGTYTSFILRANVRGQHF